MTPRFTSLAFAVILCLGAIPPGFRLVAQTTPAPAAAAGRQLGTVKSISGNTLSLATDAGQSISVTTSADTKVLKLPVGSTDLKTAQPGELSDVAVGDRVLATGQAGTPATRLVLMKSSDIAQKNAADQASWRTNGAGGIVSAIDPATGTITLASGATKIQVTTGSNTAYKRFTGDSVKYQDAKPGTLAEIRAGDQLQARGQKSADGLSVKADEVLSGSFKNLSGLIISADASTGAITLKDLATKKVMTVNVTANTNIRKMPPQMAQMFTNRGQGGAQGASGGQPGAAGGGQTGARGGAGGPGAGGGQAGAAPAGSGGAAAAGGGQGGGFGGRGGPGAPGAGGTAVAGARRAGADLSQMLNRFPTEPISDLNKGDAVMVIATEPAPGSATVTAITLLSGVEAILTANPTGGVDLSGWSMGDAPGGAAD